MFFKNKEIETLKSQIDELSKKVKAQSDALKGLNEFIMQNLEKTNKDISLIADFLIKEGRQKTVNNKKVSCFKLFLEENENV